MIRFREFAFCFLFLTNCSATNEEEQTDFQTLMGLSASIIRGPSPAVTVDTRKIITREIIDNAKVPLLFVEKEDGTNGTLGLFPNSGQTESWFGTDGAIVTLSGGRIVASRGMGEDLMGSKRFETPVSHQYYNKMRYLTKDNQLEDHNFMCMVSENTDFVTIDVFDKKYSVRRSVESCVSRKTAIENIFWRDSLGNMIASHQFHSEKIGMLLIMRLN